MGSLPIHITTSFHLSRRKKKKKDVVAEQKSRGRPQPSPQGNPNSDEKLMTYTIQ